MDQVISRNGRTIMEVAVSRPADQGNKGRMHFGIFSEVGSAKVTLHGVYLDTGPTPGALNCQSYGATQQLSSDIKCYDASNNVIPVKAYVLN